MPARASVKSWTGVKKSESCGEAKMVTAPRSINSFRTRPGTRNAPVIAGNRSHQTVNGDNTLGKAQEFQHTSVTLGNMKLHAKQHSTAR